MGKLESPGKIATTRQHRARHLGGEAHLSGLNGFIDRLLGGFLIQQIKHSHRKIFSGQVREYGICRVGVRLVFKRVDHINML